MDGKFLQLKAVWQPWL